MATKSMPTILISQPQEGSQWETTIEIVDIPQEGKPRGLGDRL